MSRIYDMNDLADINALNRILNENVGISVPPRRLILSHPRRRDLRH